MAVKNVRRLPKEISMETTTEASFFSLNEAHFAMHIILKLIYTAMP